MNAVQYCTRSADTSLEKEKSIGVPQGYTNNQKGAVSERLGMVGALVVVFSILSRGSASGPGDSRRISRKKTPIRLQVVQLRRKKFGFFVLPHVARLIQFGMGA